MKEAEIKTALKAIYFDLGKILDAALDEQVPKCIDDNGEVTDWYKYKMTDNAYDDLCGVWDSIRVLLIKMGLPSYKL